MSRHDDFLAVLDKLANNDGKGYPYNRVAEPYRTQRRERVLADLGLPKRDWDFLGVIDMVSSGLRPAGKPIRAPIGVNTDDYKNGGLP